MITIDKGNVELKGTFMVLLAELQSGVSALQQMMDDNTQLQAVFAGKSVLTVITEIDEIKKQLEESGVTPAELFDSLKNK